MGHTIRRITYANGVFEHGIDEPSKLDLNEEDEWKYIVFARIKPKFNHMEINIKVISSMRMESFKDGGDWRVPKEREIHTRYLRNNRIWAMFLEKRKTQFHHAVMLIGADPNDDRKEIKKELFKLVNSEGQKVN